MTYPSYAQAHRQHRRALAGGHCAHCGPLHVGLKPDVPLERLLIGTGRDAGLAYSVHSSDYEVLCARHHRLSDSRQRRVRTAA